MAKKNTPKENLETLRDELQERRVKKIYEKRKNMDIVDLLMDNIKSLRSINKRIFERMDHQDKILKSHQERMDYLENRKV